MTGPEQARGAVSHCLTSESLTRPSRKEQSAALWVQMWRYLHQWQGKEPFTQDRQLQRERSGQHQGSIEAEPTGTFLGMLQQDSIHR